LLLKIFSSRKLTRGTMRKAYPFAGEACGWAWMGAAAEAWRRVELAPRRLEEGEEEEIRRKLAEIQAILRKIPEEEIVEALRASREER